MQAAQLPTPCYRLMAEDDLARVLRIEAGGYAYPWSERTFRDCLQASSYECWVAERVPEDKEAAAATLLGYGIISVAAGEAHLLNLCVARNQQGRGLGRELLDWVMARAQVRHAQVMFLEVRPSNRPACDLYDSAGFNEIGVRPNYYPAANGHEDARIMAYQF